MNKHTFHLNCDKSIEGIYYENTNQIILFSTHKNQRNVSNLIGNLNKILNIDRSKNQTTIYLNDIPFVKIDTKKGKTEIS